MVEIADEPTSRNEQAKRHLAADEAIGRQFQGMGGSKLSQRVDPLLCPRMGGEESAPAVALCLHEPGQVLIITSNEDPPRRKISTPWRSASDSSWRL